MRSHSLFMVSMEPAGAAPYKLKPRSLTHL